MSAERPLDVICIGRSSVDLYGEQAGGRLEDMGSFAKYVGGCPANIAVGTSRMGLKSAILSRVGNEHMGRFIREAMVAEGVDVSHLATDSERLTALVILGIRDKETFPLIFYRENCADMALSVDDFDADFIGSAKAIVITGTHLSNPSVKAATFKAVEYARERGTKVVLDIDYRPVLWGLTEKGLGEERFVASAEVTGVLTDVLPYCDLIVGTDEEFHIAGGSTDTVTALSAVRSVTEATFVLKLGPDGCTVFEGAIPERLEDNQLEAGFPVEVFNVLGAGDAFMSGLLRGYLTGCDWRTSCQLGNASGAIVVSRHGCAPAIPSYTEVQTFIRDGSQYFSLRHDAALEQLHWSTTRQRQFPEVLAFAFDHRKQLEDMAVEAGKAEEAIKQFKALCLDAFNLVKAEHSDRGLGILCDGRLGEDTLAAASGQNIWIGRPIEYPGSRPLSFEGGPSVMATLREWPQEHCVKCLIFYHPDDTAEMREAQEQTLLRLADAARSSRHELLLEIIPPNSSTRDELTLGRAMERVYDLGVHPDWWKLPAPLSDKEWRSLESIVTARDPHCRGIVLLGLDALEEDVMQSIETAASYAICKGFAVGRTIFASAARAWFADEINSEGAVQEMADRYGRLINCWVEARRSLALGQKVSA